MPQFGSFIQMGSAWTGLIRMDGNIAAEVFIKKIQHVNILITHHVDYNPDTFFKLSFIYLFFPLYKPDR